MGPPLFFLLLLLFFYLRQILHNQNLAGEELEEFVNEIRLMSSVHHRNVIMCMGYCIKPLAIITELMHASLEKIFFDKVPEGNVTNLIYKLRYGIHSSS